VRLALLCFLLVAPLGGCSSTGEDPPPAARDMTHGDPEDGPGGRAGGGPAAESGLGNSTRPWQTWKDETEGPTATLVYVTEMGVRGKRRPAALIFSSDPSLLHFRREPSAQFTVRRLYRSEMESFLRDLRSHGLSSLPWQDEPKYDKAIGAERGLHIYESKKRRFVLKATCALEGQRRFRKLEDRLIHLTMSQ
jgi:hypothetical protein